MRDATEDREEMKRSVEGFNRYCRERGIDLSRYEYLIAPLGFSHEPPLILAQAVRPEKMLLVTTTAAAKHYDRFVELAPDFWNAYKPSAVRREEIDATNLPAVYSCVKRFCADKDPGTVLCDATGGKKTMTAAVSMAAAFLDAPIIYVDYSDYDGDKRKPVSGTEFPVFLESPHHVLADQYLLRACAYLQRFDFAGARTVLDEAERRVDVLDQVRNLARLAECLAAWSELNYPKAADTLEQVRNTRGLSALPLEAVREYLAVLCDPEHERHGAYMLADFYHRGVRYARNERYDFAVLLMYRTVEHYGQERLRCRGLDPQKVTSSDVPAGIRETFKACKEAIYGSALSPGAEEIRPPLGALDVYILGEALAGFDRDKLQTRATELEKLLSLRNTSVLAHGDRPLGEEEFKRFDAFAGPLVKKRLSKVRAGVNDIMRTAGMDWLQHLDARNTC